MHVEVSCQQKKVRRTRPCICLLRTLATPEEELWDKR